MKNIATVNTELPTIDNFIEYRSEHSLLDYDIVVFDPEFPYFSRIDFSGGGSCISIEGSRLLEKAMQHWSMELEGALRAGKTVFVLLNSHKIDALASGYTTPRKDSRNYNTYSVHNYAVLPTKLSLRNAKGSRLKVADSDFKGLFEAIKGISEYKVVLESKLNKDVFITHDGSSVLGGVCRIKGAPGHLVLLPHFEFSDMTEEVDDELRWTGDAIRTSKNVISQLVALDKKFRSEVTGTPKPDWIGVMTLPKKVTQLAEGIEKIDAKILDFEQKKEQEIQKKNELERYTGLLYENGKALEVLIEDSLKLLGYEVENFTESDLEIDHVIVGPSGLRMIGESEGKDNTAIDISKFRQLESNINEDFGRDEVDVPAKGILFGNAFRLSEPDKRGDAFTNKCLTNAKRLGTALVKTSDLYHVVLHVLDHPKDAEFKKRCREALETTTGEIVQFPQTD